MEIVEGTAVRRQRTGLTGRIGPRARTSVAAASAGILVAGLAMLATVGHGASAAPGPGQPPPTTYYGANVFAVGRFRATASKCSDAFADRPPARTRDYWDAVTPTSCYQIGAIALPPPLFDCDDGVAPDGPRGHHSVAGTDVVFDLRTARVVVTSHVIDACIPID